MQSTFDFSHQVTNEAIQRAVDHADRVEENWSVKAYEFLMSYVARTDGEFLGEDVRLASESIVPEPPSSRAWGGILRRASYQGVIKKAGVRSVKNVNAHHAIANVWKRV